jgi:hypothetical protein
LSPVNGSTVWVAEPAASFSTRLLPSVDVEVAGTRVSVAVKRALQAAPELTPDPEEQAADDKRVLELRERREQGTRRRGSAQQWKCP